MMSFGDTVVVDDIAPASDTDTSSQTAFKRVLVPVEDASQMEQVVELVRQAGVSEARVLHLNLHESIRGRRYPLETESSAAGLVEAAILELRVAGISATGQLGDALIDRAGQAIVTEATQWAADLIVLGVPRRSGLAARLFGSAALYVQRHAPCPVLVASAPASEPHGATPASAQAERMAAARSH